MNKVQYNQIYLPLQEVVYSACLAILHESEIAQDLTQDIMLKLWEQRDLLDEIQIPQAYVIRMARNRCLDHIKSAHERMRSSGEEATLALELQIDNSADPHEILVAKSMEQKLAEWTDNLKEPQRSIFRLRHYEMLSNDETAQQLGLQESTVRSTLSRLRKQARKLFDVK